MKNRTRYPLQLNFELTTRCPLRCPQCYCDFTEEKDLRPDRALSVLCEAAELGLIQLNLSGGETALYPHLFQLIDECRRLRVDSNVSLSGWGADEDFLKSLIKHGVTRIFISVNGSTDEINSQTREGYSHAVNALKILCSLRFPGIIVNWVAHENNIGDFTGMIRLCERYTVSQMFILSVKPDFAGRMDSAPSPRKLCGLAREIREVRYRSSIRVTAESCFSPLRAYLGRSLLIGNTNTGLSMGCTAGRLGASLNADGYFTPCRHLDLPEPFDSLKDYWEKSEILNRLREMENQCECPLSGNCLGCAAILLNGAEGRKRPPCPIDYSASSSSPFLN